MAAKRASRPDPDQILCAKLSGTAIRLARAGGPIGEAVAELRGLASGRSALLAEEAGLMGGFWSANPAGDPGDGVVAVGLLIMAGADVDLIPAAFELGRARRQRAADRHS